jgi:hypothetical protein
MMAGVTTTDELLAQQDERLAVHPGVRRVSFHNDTGHWNTDPSYLDSRAAILQIEHAWADRGDSGTSVRSFDVYRSVLDDGVRTPEQFDLWRESLPH